MHRLIKTVLFLGAFAVFANAGYARKPDPLHPGTTHWVDSAGSDTNSCTLAAPCRTIGHVLEHKAVDGDIIRVRPGYYREQLLITHHDLTIEGAGEGVFVLGSLIPALEPADGMYRADWDRGVSFKGTPFCANLTRDVALDDEACNTLGFWQNGVRLKQVFGKSSVIEGTFFYDSAAAEIWLKPVAGNDDLGQIEGLAHPYVVKLAASSRGVTLRNLHIWYGASLPDDGILRIEGEGHVLEHVEVRYSAGAGVEVFGADQVTMTDVRASDHGQNGWRIQADASFSTSTGWKINDWVDDLVVTGSSSRRNGWKGYDNCWGGGATKFSFTRNLIVEGFYSADNDGFGIWLDIENHDYAIRHSLSARDAGRGIFVEYISDGGTVENNVVFATRDARAVGCAVSAGLAAADSRDVVLRRNTVYTTGDDVKGMMLKTGSPSSRYFPYPSENIIWEDNLLVNKTDIGFVRDLAEGSLADFTFSGTVIEESGAAMYTCWDRLGNCSGASLGIEAVPADTYLADAQSECGYDVVDPQLAGRGAQGFTHPRVAEVCGASPPDQSPVASFSASVETFTVDFRDTSTDDGSLTAWAWDFGDGGASSGQHPTHTYRTAGAYTVTLTVTDDAGQTGAASREIAIEAPVDLQPPTAGFTYLADGLTVDFRDTSTDDGSLTAWAWDFGDGGASTERRPSHLFSAAGTYTVTLTVTDDSGLSDSISRPVTVEAEVVPGEGAFIETGGLIVMEAEHAHRSRINLTTGDVWVPETVDFDGEKATAMQARVDDGDFIRQEYRVGNATLSYEIEIETTGTYYIWLRVRPLIDGSSVYVGSESDRTRMGVTASPAPAAGWVWAGMKNARTRSQVEITASGKNVFHLWMREDGLYVDRILLTTDAGYVPKGAGPVESPRETGSMASKQKAPDRKPHFEAVKMSARENRLRETYPNPVRERLHLSLDLLADAYVRIVFYDLLGRLAADYDLGRLSAGMNREMSVDVSNFIRGHYVYRMIIEGPADVVTLPGHVVVQ